MRSDFKLSDHRDISNCDRKRLLLLGSVAKKFIATPQKMHARFCVLLNKRKIENNTGVSARQFDPF
jgi:hypothetical protein